VKSANPALGRRLRAWVLAEGAGFGGGTGEAGRVEVLSHDPVEGSKAVAAADAVVTCDGAGPLSVIAGRVGYNLHLSKHGSIG
jgi:hypothetical protein